MKNIEKIALIPTAISVGGIVTSVIGLATKNYDLMNTGNIIGMGGLSGLTCCFGIYVNGLIKEKENKKAETFPSKLNAGTDYLGE